MLNELEKLLREVTQQGGRKPPPRRHEPEMEILDEGVEIVEAEPLREDVMGHVAESMDTSDVTQRAEQLSRHASQLGAQVGQADEKLEGRLHEKFDHDIGKIHDESVTGAGQGGQEGVALSASDIVGMLSNPKSISQAVVLNEILQRPIDRW
jgi:hypothetical protein